MLPIPKYLSNSKRVFEGMRFDVITTEPENKIFRKDIIIHPGAVVILPLLDKNTVIMIQNHRVAVDEYLWELPAGTLEKDEAPLQTAHRELIEETGYQSSSIKPLFDFYTTPGICNEKMFAFVATDLTAVGQHLDESEDISVEPLEWDRILSMIKKGSICDAKTITTLLYYRFLSSF